MNRPQQRDPGSTDSYTVAWICALEEEYFCACRMLDEEFTGPEISEDYDDNTYVYGRIEKHYVPVGMAPIQLPVLPEIWFERSPIYGDVVVVGSRGRVSSTRRLRNFWELFRRCADYSVILGSQTDSQNISSVLMIWKIINDQPLTSFMPSNLRQWIEKLATKWSAQSAAATVYSMFTTEISRQEILCSRMLSCETNLQTTQS
ncbi:unnamed protein product [Aspergillus oryzae RIB40]|uniref:DNA, SC038 n=1 Tax=Aspergillus oryzae (strain ATCC 42149 / RIB 40) TaxID=510516 RepID=Q2U3K0_ASPOR|nr:unnamed protein product [Aspergillus oryzae RIB40]BAE63865.1 unnamed protein product [Aspergillus oryzae RIB40]